MLGPHQNCHSLASLCLTQKILGPNNRDAVTVSSLSMTIVTIPCPPFAERAKRFMETAIRVVFFKLPKDMRFFTRG